MVEYSTKASSETLTAVFHTLADPTRRRVVEMLASGPRSVTDLASAFPMSLPAVSKHLKVMEKAGVIQRRKRGRVHEMSLRPETLESGMQWFNWHKDFWQQQLQSLQDYLENQDQNSKTEGSQ